jgi:hypothetical protein
LLSFYPTLFGDAASPLGFDLFRFRFFGFWHADFQKPVLESRLHFVGLHVFGQMQSPHEVTIGTFRTVAIFLLGLLFWLFLAFDDQGVVRQVHLNIVLVETWTLGFDDQIILVLAVSLLFSMSLRAI